MRFAWLSGVHDWVVRQYLTRGADEAECADNVGRCGSRYCSAAPRRLHRDIEVAIRRNRRFAFELQGGSLAANQQRRETQQQELSHRLTSRTRVNYAPWGRSEKGLLGKSVQRDLFDPRHSDGPPDRAQRCDGRGEVESVRIAGTVDDDSSYDRSEGAGQIAERILKANPCARGARACEHLRNGVEVHRQPGGCPAGQGEKDSDSHGAVRKS